MVKSDRPGPRGRHTPSEVAPQAPTEDDLLHLYWTLDPEQRPARFAPTARAATLVGRTRRTVQSWIEQGAIRALRIGKIYEVDLESLQDYLRRQMRKHI